MVRRWLKRNGIVIATLLVYLAVLAGMAVEIDLRYYQERKREIITADPGLLFAEEIEPFVEASAPWSDSLESYFTAESKEEPEEREVEIAREASIDARRRPEEEAAALVAGESSIYRITLHDKANETDFDLAKPEKIEDFFDFETSLWLSGFTMSVGEEKRMGDERVAVLRYDYYWATPRNLPPEMREQVAALTRRYRGICLSIAAGWTLLVGIFLYGMVLPLRRVTGAIESSSERRTRFVEGARTSLETLYNGMARDAVLSRIQEQLGRRIHRGDVADGWRLVTSACEDLIDRLPRAAIACLELRAESGSKERRVTRRRWLAGETSEEGAAGEAALAAIEARAIRPGGGEGMVTVASLRRRLVLIAPIEDPEDSAVSYALALGLRRMTRRQTAESETRELLARFEEIIGLELQALANRRRTLDRERGRASINLSRNLGHDLTNILARSKLELATLESLLGNGQEPPTGERAETLRQSLTGLSDSTRFLQELVNLYRAYEFLKEPALEEIDVNALIRETIDLFGLATTGSLKFEAELAEDAPRIQVDPRLLKLALFNLFTNSVEAIRRRRREGPAAGVITVATARTPEGDLRLTVRDTGTGILGPDGRRLAEAEMDRVFTMGYSVREGSEGEGLGLNWVRTIVREVHGGAIRVANHTEGGAVFTMTFAAAGAGAKAD